MHVDGLDRHQRAQGACGPDDHLRGEPGVHLSVVGVHQDPLAARILAPARDLLRLAQVLIARAQG